MSVSAPGVVTFVLKGYPRLSETFIAEEIRALERAGLPIRIVALRRPTDGKTHPVHREILAPVSYVPEYLRDEPWRVFRSLVRMMARPRSRRVRWLFFLDFLRDPTRNRLRRFGQAAVLAAELPREAGQLHAHFIHTPASVARYAAAMTGLPWSCSAHAKDIWTTPDWDLSEKLADAEWTVTCTETGREKLQSLAPEARLVRLVYHGLDPRRFPPLAMPRPPRDGSDAGEPVQILAIGRAVEKKGFDLLLNALAALPDGLHWRLVHIGGGNLSSMLKAQAERLRLADRIDWRGSQDQTAVLAAYAKADLFALPCRVAEDGDRDGLPNVIVEAASQGLAVLSTPVGAVAELVRDGDTGLLAPPDDAPALAAALRRLIEDPALRRRLGKSAALRVATAFDSSDATARLMALFRAEERA